MNITSKTKTKRLRLVEVFLLLTFLSQKIVGTTTNGSPYVPRRKNAKAVLASVSPRSSSSIVPENDDELMIVNKSNHERKNGKFEPVVLVSVANVLINIFRPDESIPWPMRVPRILWEISIITIARLASKAPSEIVVLLLSIMLGVTSLIDIFFWAPIFAFLTEFETCTGGWFQPKQCVPDHVKGAGRLVVTAQSLLGGLFYLAMALVAWSDYVSFRDEQDVAKQIYVYDALEQRRKS